MEFARHRPRHAAMLARELEQQAERERADEARAVALLALGVSSRSLGDLAASQAHLKRSITVATRAGASCRVGQARTTLASVLLLRGRGRDALHEAELALPLVRGYEAARLRAQIAWILQRLDRVEEALESYGLALQAMRRLGRVADAARVRANRAILHAYQGNFPAAVTDLRTAERQYTELGLELEVAQVRHNLGFVAARRGDIPAALTWYDAAARDFERLGLSYPAALLDRCDALLSVGLAEEARHIATVAVSQLEARGHEVDVTEAQLTLAQACLFLGENEEAIRLATVARRSLVRQSRPGWVLLARYLLLRARWQRGMLDRAGERLALELSGELGRVGWMVGSVDALLMAGRSALTAGRPRVAQNALAAASAHRTHGPPEVRARAWHAEALLRLSSGDAPSAAAALRAGLRVLDRHHATLGATELRVHAAAHAGDLCALGLRLARDSGRPSALLEWAERSRASAARRPRVRPPRDAKLARDLASLRRLSAEIEDAAFAGVGNDALLRRRIALEAAVRRRAHQAPGRRPAVASRPPSVGEVGEMLGEGALVEFVDVSGDLLAVTVARGRARVHVLGRTDAAAVEVEQLRFGLGRLGRRGTRRDSLVAASSVVDHASRTLDRLLIEPLRSVVAERPLVVVPTGALHDLPWAALPSCATRPVTVAPSAAQWLSAGRCPGGHRAGGAVLVSGPGLEHAEAEVASLARIHPGAVTLSGAEASVAAVMSSIDRVELAHVAAHGTFRSDNPMFSALRLADGSLTVYDLERLASAPSTVVLAACHLGSSSVAGGDELLGFASALLTLGTSTVIAGVAPVPDTRSRELMVELHRSLRAGSSPAFALAHARTAVQRGADASDPDAADLVALAGFTCMGGG